MTDWVIGFIESIGYAGIFGLMVLEMWIPVVQSEIVMTFAGFTARVGQLSLTLVIVVGVAGSQLGSMLLYAVSRWLPEERIRRFTARHGAWVGLDDRTLRKLEDGFRDNEGKTVLIGRLLPGIRGVIAVPAGLLEMNAWKFFFYNLVGAAAWTAVLAVLGYLLGSQYRLVDQYASWVGGAVIAVLIGLVVWRAVKVRRARQEAAA